MLNLMLDKTRTNRYTQILEDLKTLALRTMADDVLKVDVNDATSIFSRVFMTFCKCVSLFDGNKHCVEY